MTHRPVIISEPESAALVDCELALAAAREAFLATATSTTFPVVIGHSTVPHNRFTLKSGSTADLVGVKIGSFWPDNVEVPRHSSTIVLLDPATGRLHAVVEAAAANAYRTAAADALAVATLARADSRTLTVFGTGHQALHEVRAVGRVRPIERVLVVGRRAEAAQAFAAEVTAQTGLPAGATDARSGVTAADVLVTATSSREPLFDASWVGPGTHISAMGADGPGKQELPVAIHERASLFCDLPHQSRAIGEFQHAPAAAPVALGSVLAGDAAGRTAPDEVTVFDSSGFALQDLTLAAALMRRRAANEGAPR